MIRYAHVDKIGGHPVHQFLINGAGVIVAKGHAQLASVNYDLQAVYAFDFEESKIVGAMAYSFETWNNVCHISWAYVDQLYRRKGIHTQLTSDVEERATLAGCYKITRGTHITNAEAQLAFEAEGYAQTFVTYERVLLSPTRVLCDPPKKLS